LNVSGAPAAGTPKQQAAEAALTHLVIILRQRSRWFLQDALYRRGEVVEVEGLSKYRMLKL
jgi:hypothetical protein